MHCPTCHTPVLEGATACAACGARWSVAETTDPLLDVLVDGRYRLEEKIGGGGMGSVYRATQLAVDREVAVKVVNALALQDPATVKRFETEARIISQLRHPNTLKLIDFGKLPDERPYLVTELLRGRPLSARLAEGPLPPRPALEIIHQICDALAEAHANGIIHRDLKPENIFLEDQPERTAVRVLDFGIAKLGQTNNTATGTVCGTPAYMSPEQAQGGAADARSDIYALGVLAYRCLVGRPPFEGEQPLAVLLKHIQEAPVPLSQVLGPQAVPGEVEWLVMTMLAKDPAQRPASALEVKGHIEHILARVPVAGAAMIAAVTPEPVSAQPLPAMTATPTHGTPVPAPFVADLGAASEPSLFRVVGVGLVALAVCIAAGAFLWRQGDAIPVVEAVVAAPVTPVASSAPAAEAPPPAEAEADVPPLEVAPEDEDAAEVEAAPDRARKKKTRRKRRPRRRDRRPDRAESEPPPGFTDFEL